MTDNAISYAFVSYRCWRRRLWSLYVHVFTSL